MSMLMRLELQVLEDIDAVLNPDENADRERFEAMMRETERKKRRVMSNWELERSE